VGVTQLVLIILSLVVLDQLRQRVPWNIQGFVEDLRRHADILLLFLVHRIIAHGATYYTATTESFRSYSVLIGIWQLAIPLLVLVYYAMAKKEKLWDLRFAVTLAIAFYVVDSVGLFTVASQDVGWLDTQSLSQGIDVWQLGKQVLFGVAYYAYVAVAEELFFRVALFELLKKWMVRTESIIVVVTGVVFGLAHCVSLFNATGVGRMGAILNVFSTTLMGIGWGAVYARRRNLLHVAFLHWWVWIANIGAKLFVIAVYLLRF